MSVSTTVSQPSMANTNPFLDDDLHTSISENVIGDEESSAKKRRAPFPPQLAGPDLFSRGDSSEHHSISKEISKRPAPQPPDILKISKDVTLKEKKDQAGIYQRAKETPERHHISSVDTNPFTCDRPVDVRPAPKPGSGITVLKESSGYYSKSLKNEDAIIGPTDDLSGGEDLKEIVQPDFTKPHTPSAVDWELSLEPLLCKTDSMPSMNRVQKKSRAPIPPAKPKRTEDPSKIILELAPDNRTYNKDQNNAWTSSVEIPASSTSSSSVTSSVTKLAEKLQVIKPCVTESVETGRGAGSRTLPWAKVVPNDACEVREQVASTSVIRQQAVKPLSSAENPSEVHKSRITDYTQPKTKVAEAGIKGPYSQLTQAELIALALRQQEQISKRDARIQELEQYIDNLLVRVIEEKPSILLSMNIKNKPV